MSWGDIGGEREQRLDNCSRPPCPTDDALCREPAQAFSHPTLILQGRRGPRAAPPMPGVCRCQSLWATCPQVTGLGCRLLSASTLMSTPRDPHAEAEWAALGPDSHVCEPAPSLLVAWWSIAKVNSPAMPGAGGDSEGCQDKEEGRRGTLGPDCDPLSPPPQGRAGTPSPSPNRVHGSLYRRKWGPVREVVGSSSFPFPPPT